LSTEKIDAIRVGDRLRKDLQDLKSLAESIAAVGLLHPIVIDSEQSLIAGERRLEACKSLGWDQIPVTVVDLENVLRGQVDENTARADFQPSEIYAIQKAFLGPESEKAKSRQIASLKKGTKLPVGKTFPNGGKRAPKADEKVAAIAGTSRVTMAKIVEVVAAAEAEPEKYSHLVEEMDKTKRVAGVHKKLKVQQQAEELEAEPKPLPQGPYRVIVIDPPWQYSNRAEDSSHRVANPYTDMGQSDLLNMPIGDLAHDDCVLWLWSTNAFIGDALELVKAWGFTQKTILSWVKNRMGTGDWLRGKTEHCLLAVRGKPTVRLTNQTTALIAPAGGHSEKPQEFYAMVDQLCPGSKIDVFARRKREGWAAYGHEMKTRVA